LLRRADATGGLASFTVRDAYRYFVRQTVIDVKK